MPAVVFFYTMQEPSWVAEVQEVLNGDAPGTLLLAGAELNDEGCEKLAAMVAGAPDKVQELTMMFSGVTAAGMVKVCDALAGSPTLLSLYVD